jgi:hypothetical protein
LRVQNIRIMMKWNVGNKIQLHNYIINYSFMSDLGLVILDQICQ